MTISRRIAKNTIFMIMDSVVSRILGLVIYMLLFRRLGVSEFGVYSFAISFPALFLFISDFGLEFYGIRETAAHRENSKEFISKIIPLKIVLFSVSFLMVLTALAFTSDQSDKQAVVIFSLYVLGRTFITFFSSIIKGFEEMQYSALLSVLESVFAVCFVVFVIKNGDSAAKVGTWYCATLSIVIFIAIIFVIRFTGFQTPRIDFRFWKKTLLATAPFAVINLCVLMHGNADIIMVKYIKGNLAVGLYKPCVIILGSAGAVQIALTTAVLPAVTRFFEKDPGALEITYEKAFKLLAVTGWPIYIGGAILAKPLLALVFPGSEAASGALAILSVAYLFSNFGAFYAAFSAGINRQIYYVRVTLFIVVLNIALNCFFIPYWGIKGASAATVVSEGIHILWIHFTIMRSYRKFSIVPFLFKLSLALCAMGATAHLARNFNVIIAIAIGGITYISMIFIIKPYSLSDKELFKKVFFRNRKSVSTVDTIK